MSPLSITFYTKYHCPLCDKAHKILQELQEEIPMEIHKVDIYGSDELIEKYGLMIPVIAAGDEEIQYGQIHKESLRKRLLTINK
ncbi:MULTISPECIES: glutaredoxin family protein [Fictibacillus]|uniref:Glutaredoxin family protein n=1 Tax=Fictibacillus terranigra TaxID=3058424 RepID=A0ABT8E2N9_9BACL|nr:glutaredoxin family protein [Fictibacillus sp. CENA-BCM004]MDN4072146.1 glutaredoxin family protein [Fictibacillus sp. CENA-BCM004]